MAVQYIEGREGSVHTLEHLLGRPLARYLLILGLALAPYYLQTFCHGVATRV